MNVVDYYNSLKPPSIPDKILKAEQKICVAFSNYLRERTIKGDFPFIWFHVPNEFYRNSSKNSKLFGSICNAMGRISGVADYCFVGKKNSFFIEFKTEKGTLSPNQKFFQNWAKDQKINYFICRSLEEGIATVHQCEENLKNKTDEACEWWDNRC